jgi:hypothetical protein
VSARVQAAALLLACLSLSALGGCLEPNPYAPSPDAETGEAGEIGDDTTGAPTACPDPDHCLGLAQIEFSIQGNNSFSAEIPKPAGSTTSAPIAAIRRYQPGQSETLAWSVRWTESASSWAVEVTASGGAPNSRIAGVAAVLGFGDALPAPSVHELTVTTTDGCAQLPISAGELVLDTVEAYAPEGAAVVEFSRTELIAAGEPTAIEYCVSQPEQLDASLRVKLISFDLPDNALAAEVATVLDAQTDGGDSFAAFGEAREVVQLVGARTLTEASSPNLGWRFECAATPPYACTYALVGGSSGVMVEAGGAALAIR